jgi:hypothetical protein
VTEGESIQGAVLKVVISDSCLRTSFLSLTLPNLDKTWKAGTVLSYPSNQTSVKGSCFSHFGSHACLSNQLITSNSELVVIIPLQLDSITIVLGQPLKILTKTLPFAKTINTLRLCPRSTLFDR